MQVCIQLTLRNCSQFGCLAFSLMILIQCHWFNARCSTGLPWRSTGLPWHSTCTRRATIRTIVTITLRWLPAEKCMITWQPDHPCLRRCVLMKIVVCLVVAIFRSLGKLDYRNMSATRWHLQRLASLPPNHHADLLSGHQIRFWWICIIRRTQRNFPALGEPSIPLIVFTVLNKHLY